MKNHNLNNVDFQIPLHTMSSTHPSSRNSFCRSLLKLKKFEVQTLNTFLSEKFFLNNTIQIPFEDSLQILYWRALVAVRSAWQQQAWPATMLLGSRPFSLNKAFGIRSLRWSSFWWIVLELLFEYRYNVRACEHQAVSIRLFGRPTPANWANRLNQRLIDWRSYSRL